MRLLGTKYRLIGRQLAQQRLDLPCRVSKWPTSSSTLKDSENSKNCVALLETMYWAEGSRFLQQHLCSSPPRAKVAGP